MQGNITDWGKEVKKGLIERGWSINDLADQIATTYKVAGKPVNTWVPGIMSGIKRNEFSEYRIPDRKQSYL